MCSVSKLIAYMQMNCAPFKRRKSDPGILKTMRKIKPMAKLDPAYHLSLSQLESETLAAGLIRDTAVLYKKLLIWQMPMLSDS